VILPSIYLKREYKDAIKVLKQALLKGKKSTRIDPYLAMAYFYDRQYAWR